MKEIHIEKLKPGVLYELKEKSNQDSHWSGLIIAVTEQKDGYIYFEKVNRFDEFVGINSIGHTSSISDWYIFIEIGNEKDFPEYFI
jgi:hypothetical protein